MLLPYEIIFEISNFTRFSSNKNILTINKYFFGHYKKKYLKNIKFIQKIYRKYRIPDFFFSTKTFLTYIPYHKWQVIFNKNNKIRIYRYLIIKKMSYLVGYPEYLIKKSHVLNSSRYYILNDWIQTNLPANKMLRTRRHILLFLKDNRITLREINNAGL
jgi:hypothetical protein